MDFSAWFEAYLGDRWYTFRHNKPRIGRILMARGRDATNDFIAEAARLFGDSLTRQTEDITNMIPLYALVGRMRLVSARGVIDAAVRIEDTILEAYMGPNRSLHELRELARKGGINFLTDFGEACREDLAARAR